MASFTLQQTVGELEKDVTELERDVAVIADKFQPKMKSDIAKKRRACISSQFQGRSGESNIFGLAYNREHGSTRNSHFASEIPAARMKTLSVSNTFKTIDDELLVSDCEFIRGGLDDHSVVGLWTGDQYNSIMYKLEFELSSQCSKKADDMPAVVRKCKRKGPFFTKTHVVDLCDTFYKQLSCVLYAGIRNTSGTSLEGISVLCSYTTSPPAMGSLLLACKELHCCVGSSEGDVFAMGTEKGVYVFSQDQLIPMPEYVGNITSVEFNKSSQLLYCGTSASVLVLIDVREHPQHTFTSNITDLCETGVSETKLFWSENSIILSGYDGTLSKVDLRMNKVLLRYSGHVGNERKIPFSFNEHLNMLCATGSDNMTRLWSLDSGTLLSTIRPHYTNNKANSYLICNNDKWAVAIFQKDKMYTVEPSI